MPIDKQNEIIRKLELPVTCMVYSGGKSVHAIVKSKTLLITTSTVNGSIIFITFVVKTALKSTFKTEIRAASVVCPALPVRIKKQFLVDTNIGKSSFAEWQTWIESINDNLPEPESLRDFWNKSAAVSTASYRKRTS